MNPFKLFGPRTRTAEQTRLVREKKALLVDLREFGAWCDGIAKAAALLPYSDLSGPRELWGPFLAQRGDRELLLYSSSAALSAAAARLLSAEGIAATGAGTLHDWDRAGWPVCKPRGCRHGQPPKT